MWTQLKTNAIAALTITALALGATAPANAMDDQTRNLIKGVAAAVIIGTLLSTMGDDRPAPQPRYAPQPQPPRLDPPRAQHMAPPPRPAMPAYHAQRFDPPPRPRAPQPGDDRRLRDYADRNGGGRHSYDVPRLDLPPRHYPMR